MKGIFAFFLLCAVFVVLQWCVVTYLREPSQVESLEQETNGIVVDQQETRLTFNDNGVFNQQETKLTHEEDGVFGQRETRLVKNQETMMTDEDYGGFFDQHETGPTHDDDGVFGQRETRLTYEDDGVFVFENACLRRSQRKTRTYLEIVHNKTLANKVNTPTIATWTVVTSVEHVEDTTRFVPHDTVYLLRLKNNPAHCLIDQTLNLFVHITRMKRSLPYNQYYLASDTKGVRVDCVNSKEWCCWMWSHFGFIDHNAAVKIGDDERVCFKELVFPKHMALRFGGLDVFDNSSLKTMKSMVNNHIDSPKFDVTIITREDASRRVWVNAKKLQEQLALNYTVNYVGRDYATYTVEEQVALFAKSSIIIAVHGAALANLIFTNPGTIVFELTCFQKAEQLSDSNWYGTPTWFSPLSERFGNNHFVYKAKCSSFNSETLTVDVNDFLHIFKSRIHR